MQGVKKLIAILVSIAVVAVAINIPVSALSWIEEEDIQVSKREGYAYPLETSKVIPRCKLVIIGTGICRFAAKALSAHIYTQTSYDTLYILKPGDTKALPVQNTSRTNYHYYFSEYKDVMVVVHTVGLTGVTQADVYKDISQTLTLAVDENFNETYKLPAPSFTIRMPSGQPAEVQYGALSLNGDYFVTQVENIGLVKLDVNSLEVELFSRDLYLALDYESYVIGVSDNGRSATVAGRNGGLRVYNIGQTCSRANFATFEGNELCPSIELDYRMRYVLGIPQDATTPGNMLLVPIYTDTSEVVVGPYSANGRNSVKITTTDDGSAKLDYLALGDSFSSGEGDIGRQGDGSSYYLAGTDAGNDNCHISSRSYPYSLRGMWEVPSSDMRSVACSGARVVYDYGVYEGDYLGQDDRLKDRGDTKGLQDGALQNFMPGYVQQIEFVKKYRPKMITLTGGGNDIGFARILRYCASFQTSDFVPFINTTCEYAQPGSSLNKMLYAAIDTQYVPLTQFVDEVAEVSPNTRVVLVGYPSFIAEYDGTLCMGNVGVLNIDEMRLINNATARLNEVIKKVAQDKDVEYVDIMDSLYSGRICEGSEYVTDVARGMAGQAGGAELFHPNAEGHRKIAQAIYDSRIYTTKFVPSSTYVPPLHTTTYQKPLYASDSPIYYGEQKQITTEQGLLMPGTSYDLTAHSEPKPLGTFTAQSDGSATATVSFADIPPGEHMLVLEGIAPGGTPVTYYQFIEVRYSSDDADGDGIKDVDDRCNFISHWYDETTGVDVCVVGERVKKGETLLTPDNEVRLAQPWYVTEGNQYVLSGGEGRNKKSQDLPSLARTTQSIKDSGLASTTAWLAMVSVILAISGIMSSIIWGHQRGKKTAN